MNAWTRKLEHILHITCRGVPLWVVGTCGLAGVLIDIDHPIAYWITGKTSRPLHTPLAIVSCIILCGVSACIGRLYYKFILKEKK